jgi:two-component system CheB/CheR fusion protein
MSDASHAHTPSASHIRVVGIGASAGGLEALEQFFTNVPLDSGLAYVVVQHMDPTHQAMLSALLQRVTALPVCEAAHDMVLNPNSVYVIQPNSELTVSQGRLRLTHPQRPRGMRLPIDVLFSSIAQDLGDDAIGVVLSGMGSDGSNGLQAIKTRGGLTLVQEPATAQFDSMPQSAINAGCVDIIAQPAELPQRIVQITSRPHTEATSAPRQSDNIEAPLKSILALLREHCQHDLSLYKTSTLVRRIERRVAVHALNSMQDYALFLQHNPQELALLFAEMLIGVTAFFRDPLVWSELQTKILPDLLAKRSNTPQLRAWIAGCSTGEEAYSLAMAFKEVQDTLPSTAAHTLQIFATDLSAEAIAVARKGLYPAKALQDMPASRVNRFFCKQDGGYLIDKSIRNMVLFAQHDVILDPPFTRLDLLSCRNVLIYFNAALQKRLMPLFHYSLRPGGVLMLGGSETVGRAQTLFTPISPKTRLYTRSDHALHASAIDFPVNSHMSPRANALEPFVSTPSPHPQNLQTLADQVLLQTYSPPAVLVNDEGDILYISGRTGKYLEPAAGKANWNIHVMARPGLRTQLAVALRQTLKDGQAVELRGLRTDDDAPYSLHITVQAVREPKTLDGTVMIVFREVEQAPSLDGSMFHPDGPLDVVVAKELARSREEIQALRQDMIASKQELQASNEALQSSNEELQSANEELTTSKEEAQSMNEELQTINGELQTKLDDLALAQSDMQNLLNSTDIATLFLDHELNVRRFTEQTTRIFNLREADIGRPLTDLASTLSYPDLYTDAKQTLRTLTPSEKQIPTTNGHWFSVRIMPYRTLTNMIQGAVITFVDITKAKELESQLRKG